MVLTEWNKFVKKIYHENKSKPGYRFRDALTDASARKGEMKQHTNTDTNHSQTRSRKKRSSSRRKRRHKHTSKKRKSKRSRR